MQFATRTIHAAQPSDPGTGSLIAPIFQTSTYEQESPACNLGFDYSRTNNPTRQRLEEVLADLEGVSHCAVFASGLAAENAVLQAYLRPGDESRRAARRLRRHVSHPERGSSSRSAADHAGGHDRSRARRRGDHAGDAAGLAGDADQPAPDRVRHRRDRAHRPCRAARSSSSTTPSPRRCFQQPFALGADIVVHSVTKYLAGHSDLIQGAVLARDAAMFEPIKFLQNAIGAVPAPLDCWLTLRGLKTLELRVQRHAENAARDRRRAERASTGAARLLSGPRRRIPGTRCAKRR